MRYFLSIILFLAIAHTYTQEHIHHDFSINSAHDHDAHMPHMHGMYGNYPMTREASGTSWVPDSSPPEVFHIMHNCWNFMMGGFSYLVIDHQSGPRGGEKLFDENMFMFMGQRDFEKNTLAFRTMFSLEPITIGKCGYPLLFQTGETCNGVTPLIDRQHPHDLFMELALVGSHRFNENSSAFLYFGLPGEPALGPPVFMMRFASEYIPEAPLGHHWMDSTHITFGVATLGYIYKGLKFETSVFTGREPDENRFDIEKPRFDSYSFRVSLNPTENLSLQASYGHLKSPEQLHPEVNINRTTASAIYNKGWDCSNLQIAAIVGVNDSKPGNKLPAFLLDTTLEIKKRHLFFSRFERVKKDDLFIAPDPLADSIVTAQKLTLGYVFEFLGTKHSKWGLGGLLDIPLISPTLQKHYGDKVSYMLFLEIKLI